MAYLPRIRRSSSDFEGTYPPLPSFFFFLNTPATENQPILSVEISTQPASSSNPLFPTGAHPLRQLQPTDNGLDLAQLVCRPSLSLLRISHPRVPR
jgi:hypothetical protein